MSQLGKKPLEILKGVQVVVANNAIEVTGPKGKLQKSIDLGVVIRIEDGKVYSEVKGNSSDKRALQGLFRALIRNMMIGVSEGFEKKLELSGVGYRAELQGKKLNMSLGFSHPVSFDPPAGITFIVEAQTKIKISGIDKALVGQVAADIRSTRPVEPYKGKGIKYSNEKVIRKAGKAAKAAGA